VWRLSWKDDERTAYNLTQESGRRLRHSVRVGKTGSPMTDEQWIEIGRRCPNCANPIGSLVFAFLALLALASPVAASPLCAAAIDHDWGATSTPEPSWALKTCELVASAADRHDVRAALVLSVASVESDFRPYVCSSSGACGALQVKQRYHCRTLFGWRACLTARALVDAGVRHLAELLDEMPERRALRCYNAGRRGCSSSPKAGARYASAVASVERRIR